MNLYTLALFVHVLGVIGIFAGLGVWLFGLAALGRMQHVEQVRAIAGVVTAAGYLVVGSLLPLGVGGFYMALTTWGLRATWIIVATVSFILLAPAGAVVIDPRVRAIGLQARAAPDGPLPAELAKRTHDPILGIGLHVYIAVLLGIVYLMTTKPALAPSIVAMVVAVAIGLASGVFLWWASRSREGATVTHASRR
ncbi:MAG TPA: DUF2269 family protein [Ktedonobacterales bacterium]|jgi:hypothetical protein